MTQAGKWTPGPWQVDVAPRNDLMGNSWLVSDGNRFIASLGMENRIKGGEHAANAHLIAQAPAMAEVLQELLAEDLAGQTSPQIHKAEQVLREAGVM